MKSKAFYNSDSSLESQEARANAAENASELLTDAAVCVDTLLKHDEHMSTAPKHPTLVAAHALLSLLDFEGGRIAKALEEIAESLDFIAAEHENHASPLHDDLQSLSEQERWQIYEILKAGFIRNNPASTSPKYERAMRLYTDLLGL